MTASATSSPRLASLDIAKGLFVLAMVFYHSLNYSSEYYLAFRYLSFLPPSFIFIAGYLVIALYPNRYQADTRRMYLRLIVRGLRLILIFTLLNLGGLMVARSYHPLDVPAVMWENGVDIFVIGSGRYAIFEVLLPIGYFLVISPLILWVHGRGRLPLLVLGIFSVAGTAWLNHHGVSSGNLNLLAAGVLGASVAPFVRLEHLAGGCLKLAVLAGAFAAYELIGRTWGHVFEIQILGSTIAVFLFLAFAQAVPVGSWPVRRMIILGQYSLLGYILQIAVLQVILRLSGRPEPWSVAFHAWMIATLVAMTLLVEATHLLRSKSPLADRAYRLVFA